MFVKRFVQHRKNQLAAVVEECAENVVIRGAGCHKMSHYFLFIVAQNGGGVQYGQGEMCYGVVTEAFGSGHFARSPAAQIRKPFEV